VAVIVNEFGAVGIDSKLVVQADEQILQMNNGCICCTVRSEPKSLIYAGVYETYLQAI
jgi:G3E family GTPase